MRIAFDTEERQENRENVLARLDDVSNEAFMKKYMKKVEDGTLPDDNRTVDEIQKEEQAMQLASFASWCGIEDEIDLETDDPADMLSQIAQEMTEGSKEVLELAEKQRIENIEYDASEKIKQVTEFSVDVDDPLNIQEYKDKKEKVIEGLLMMSQKSEQQKENEKTYQSSYSEDTSPRFRNSGSGFGSRVNVNDRQYKSSKSKQKIIDIDDLEEKKRAYWDNLVDDKNMAYQAAVDGKGYRVQDDRPPNYKKLFAGKKFRSKNLWHNVKSFLRTNKARAIVKFGIMISFEMMMAILAGKREFDGNGQMLAYLGMVMGAFIIGNELIKEGYDPRKIQFD